MRASLGEVLVALRPDGPSGRARRRLRGVPVFAWLVLALFAASRAPARAEAARETASPAPLPLRVFELEHRPVDEAYALLAPLLSDHADVHVVRAARRIEVRDEPERLERIAQAIAAFDVAPKTVRVAVRVVKGEKREGAPEPGADTTPGVPHDVREMLGYNAFETLGSVDLAVREGAHGNATLGPEEKYRIDLEVGRVDTKGGTIELKLLSFERRFVGPDGAAVYKPVFQLQEELQSGRKRVLCATPSATDRRALFLLVTGTID